MEQTEVVASAAGTSEDTSAGTATEAMAAGAVTEDASASTTTAGTDDTASSTAAAATEEVIPADETPEQRRDRRQRQREKRQQPAPSPTAAEPVKTPEQIIAEHEANQRVQREAQERQQREQQEYASFYGDDPSEPNNPQAPTRYQKLWQAANVDIPEFPLQGTQADLDVHNKRIADRNQARRELAELDARRTQGGKVYGVAHQMGVVAGRNDVGNQLESVLAEHGLPVQEMIAAITDPSKPLNSVFRDAFSRVKAGVTADLQPKIDDLEDDLAAMTEDRDSWMRKAGGAAPQPLRGGVAAGVGGSLTFDRYMAMDPSERMRLRSTPEGRAQIDAMTQGRNGAA